MQLYIYCMYKTLISFYLVKISLNKFLGFRNAFYSIDILGTTINKVCCFFYVVGFCGFGIVVLQHSFLLQHIGKQCLKIGLRTHKRVQYCYLFICQLCYSISHIKVAVAIVESLLCYLIVFKIEQRFNYLLLFCSFQGFCERFETSRFKSCA